MTNKLRNPFDGRNQKNPVLEWVELTIEKSEIDILTADRAALEDKFRLLVGTMDKEKRSQYPEKSIQSALNELEREAKEKKLTELKARIAFKKPNNLLAQYAECISGNQNKAFEAAKVGHFIWQVKRKIFGLPVKDHMMLVLTGPQAGGKSFTVENQLCSPIKDYVSKYDFDVFDQNFMQPLYERNYVIFFDELSKMNKADANRLKFYITTPTLDGRRINTESFRQYRQNSTFIGTSNDSLDEQLQDTTGSRRFCEIQTLQTEEFKRNHRILESIDYATLWQGIDENASSPIVPFKETLRIEQAELTPKHHIEEFIEDTLAGAHEDAFTSNEEMNRRYHEWCNQHDQKKRLSRNILTKKLLERGLESARRNNERGIAVNLK